MGEAARVLVDGTYDVIVVDAGATPDGAMSLELAVLAGPSKGEVISLRGPAGEADPIDLLGLPATVTVVDGRPTVQLEP